MRTDHQVGVGAEARTKSRNWRRMVCLNLSSMSRIKYDKYVAIQPQICRHTVPPTASSKGRRNARPHVNRRCTRMRACANLSNSSRRIDRQFPWLLAPTRRAPPCPRCATRQRSPPRARNPEGGIPVGGGALDRAGRRQRERPDAPGSRAARPPGGVWRKAGGLDHHRTRSGYFLAIRAVQGGSVGMLRSSMWKDNRPWCRGARGRRCTRPRGRPGTGDAWRQVAKMSTRQVRQMRSAPRVESAARARSSASGPTRPSLMPRARCHAGSRRAAIRVRRSGRGEALLSHVPLGVPEAHSDLMGKAMLSPAARGASSASASCTLAREPGKQFRVVILGDASPRGTTFGAIRRSPTRPTTSCRPTGRRGHQRLSGQFWNGRHRTFPQCSLLRRAARGGS